MASKKILMIIAFETFRDEEYAHPREIFDKAGFEVAVASNELGTATGRFGLKVPVDMLFTDARPDEYDAVVFVGGGGARVFFDSAPAHNIASSMLNSGKIVSAICIAPSILANAGLLRGIESSVYPSENGLLTEKGAVLTGKPVTRSGQIITGSGPEAAYDFANALVEALEARGAD